MRPFILIISVFVLMTLSGCQTTDQPSTTTTTQPSSSSQEPSTSRELSAREVIDLAIASLGVPGVTEENLILPTEVNIGGKIVAIAWHSTASSVITSTGVITRAVSDQSATLIATFTYLSELVQNHYLVVVKSNPAFLILFAVANSLVKFDSFTIDSHLELPSTYLLDTHLISASWSSNRPEILSDSGVVTLTQKQEIVVLTLTLEYEGAIRIETYTFTVLPNPESLPANYFHLAPVYLGTILNETSKPATPACFAGAVYRKVFSNRDQWLGIETVVTLPLFVPDPLRIDNTRPTLYLDNASVYLGGNAYNESDVGVSWMIGHISATNPGVSRSGVAFRPFWRYITTQESCTNNNCFRHAHVTNYATYYFPGDKLRISVFSTRPNYLQMRVEILELTTHPDFVNHRKNVYQLPDDFPRIFISDEFHSAGVGVVNTEYKRVNALDQVANEGKPTLNTNARSEDTKWHEVYLYRRIDGDLVKVPMTANRAAYMACPSGTNVNGNFSQAFQISTSGIDVSLGGEVVTIAPNNGTGKLYNTTQPAIIIPRKEEL